jgi:type II secretory ATPase GspE/PulE/Tfp pilus assembly ATPase PilB-like protein
LLHHLKTLCHINTAENRRPQDGRLADQSIRASFCPTLLGEKCVLRFLHTGLKKIHLSGLGLLPEQLNMILAAIHQPQGLILITGPTGSGKSVSLYSILDELNSTEKNIVTIEDPIEMPIPGLTQTQVNIEMGLDFSDLLRTLLRQDPNILMIGEIRDEKTAKMAIHASQTGHLVFSTLHANSALESLFRLESLNIDRFTLSQSVLLLMAQRLVRKKDGGRCALFEVVPMTRRLKEAYLARESLPTPKLSLHAHGLELIQKNMVTNEEVTRVLG